MLATHATGSGQTRCSGTFKMYFSSYLYLIFFQLTHSKKPTAQIFARHLEPNGYVESTIFLSPVFTKCNTLFVCLFSNTQKLIAYASWLVNLIVSRMERFLFDFWNIIPAWPSRQIYRRSLQMQLLTVIPVFTFAHKPGLWPMAAARSWYLFK